MLLWHDDIEHLFSMHEDWAAHKHIVKMRNIITISDDCCTYVVPMTMQPESTLIKSAYSPPGHPVPAELWRAVSTYPDHAIQENPQPRFVLIMRTLYDVVEVDADH